MKRASLYTIDGKIGRPPTGGKWCLLPGEGFIKISDINFHCIQWKNAQLLTEITAGINRQLSVDS